MATHLTSEQFDTFTRERYARHPAPGNTIESAGIASLQQAAVRSFIAEMRQAFGFPPIEATGKVKSAARGRSTSPKAPAA